MTDPDAPLKSVMRAWQHDWAAAKLEDGLTLNPAAPVPTPSPNQHLVQVIATSLNPADYKIFEIPLVSRWMLPFPPTPCTDFAGRVIVPAAGSSIQRGQLVFGGASKRAFAQGVLADYAAVDQDAVAALPEGVKPAHAATARVAGLTAYQTIAPNVKRGDSVFINGGSGGTGTFGIQIAKALGCHVTTTCSSANVDLCKRLGANEVVDYRKHDVITALKRLGRKFNHVVDNVSDPKLYYRAQEFSEPDAIYVMVGGSPSLSFALRMATMWLWPRALGGGALKLKSFLPEFDSSELAKVADLVKTQGVEPVIDSQFSFDEIPQAYAKLRGGRTKGKIVVSVNA